MVASVSITIRYALMGVILAGAFFTVQSEAQVVRKSLHRDKMSEVANYVSTELEENLKMVYEYNRTVKKKLHLPPTKRGYGVKLECTQGNVLVNVSGNLPKERSIKTTRFKCGWVNASGEVFPGERCMILNKKNSTLTNVKLVNNCVA